MGRPPNTEARRAEIVEAMIRVMGRRGYAKASVAAIAREAGLAPGLVHYHFRTKQDVLLALVERVAGTVESRFEVRLEGAHSALERLDAFLDAHLQLGEDADPAAVACWVALGTEALATPAVREAYLAVMEGERDTLEDLVRAALREAGRPVDTAPQAAAGLLAAIEGAFRLAAIAPTLIPEGSAAGTVRAMARALLRASS